MCNSYLLTYSFYFLFSEDPQISSLIHWHIHSFQLLNHIQLLVTLHMGTSPTLLFFRACTHSWATMGDLPTSSHPTSMSPHQHQPTWKGRRVSGAIRGPAGSLEGALPGPCTSSNFTVYWADLWEKVIKACKSSCCRENYLYKQSVITGIREATCGKGH